MQKSVKCCCKRIGISHKPSGLSESWELQLSRCGLSASKDYRHQLVMNLCKELMMLQVRTAWPLVQGMPMGSIHGVSMMKFLMGTGRGHKSTKCGRNQTGSNPDIQPKSCRFVKAAGVYILLVLDKVYPRPSPYLKNNNSPIFCIPSSDAHPHPGSEKIRYGSGSRLNFDMDPEPGKKVFSTRKILKI